MRSRFITASALALMAAAPMTFGQQSASYRLSEGVFNSCGRAGSSALTSATYRIRLDAMGGSFSDLPLSGPSLRLAGGFVADYRPAGPVPGLSFSASDALEWGPERSAGSYNVYRGALPSFPLASDASTCLLSGLTSRSVGSLTAPPPGQAFYYFVSARNLLDEEGPSRVDPSGVPHAPSNPCPGP